MFDFLRRNKDVLAIVLGTGAFLGGMISVINYYNTKALRKIQEDNAILDKEIKLLDVELKRQEVQKTKG